MILMMMMVMMMMMMMMLMMMARRGIEAAILEPTPKPEEQGADVDNVDDVGDVDDLDGDDDDHDDDAYVDDDGEGGVGGANIRAHTQA